MAGFLTTYGATAALNGTAMPTTWYAKGHLDDPGPAATLHPAVETRRLTVIMATAVDGVALNAARVALGGGAAATEDWTYITLWDNLTAGNPWWVVPLDTALVITAGNALYIPLGSLSLELVRWV